MIMTRPIYAIERQQSQEAADRNFDAITSEAPWMLELPGMIERIIAENASARSRFRKLRNLADRVNEVMSPRSACTRGCSACCNIAVSISAFEADLIGQAIGRTPRKVPGTLDAQRIQAAYFGTPCSFLKNGECSIYEHRPLECRLHANIGHSPALCSTDVPIEESSVPNLDFQPFHIAYVALTVDQRGLSDLRDYFPTELA